MKHYKKPDNSIWAFESDGSQDNLVTPDMMPLSDDGLAALRAPTQDQIRAQFTGAIQTRLDEFARTRGYDGILSACSYSGSSIPAYAADGGYCIKARDISWEAAGAVLQQVMTGARSVPTLDQLIAEMPALVWPT